MADPKHEKTEAQKSTDELLKERQSDATDDETLKEAEESRRNLKSGNTNRESAPSPDGGFDEPHETKDADPM